MEDIRSRHRMMRERVLSLCAAFWGLAIAVALLPWWASSVPPGQLPRFRDRIRIRRSGSFPLHRWRDRVAGPRVVADAAGHRAARGFGDALVGSQYRVHRPARAGLARDQRARSALCDDSDGDHRWHLRGPSHAPGALHAVGLDPCPDGGGGLPGPARLLGSRVRKAMRPGCGHRSGRTAGRRFRSAARGIAGFPLLCAVAGGVGAPDARLPVWEAARRLGAVGGRGGDHLRVPGAGPQYDRGVPSTPASGGVRLFPDRCVQQRHGDPSHHGGVQAAFSFFEETYRLVPASEMLRGRMRIATSFPRTASFRMVCSTCCCFGRGR
jgi:hypothetical protein